MAMKQQTVPNPLVVALGMFTTIPMPSVENIDARLASRAMAAFPVVGLVVGILAGAVTWSTGWLVGPLLGAVLGLATLAWLTGALHLDGLADTADGLGSRKPAAPALEIMRRSDVGPMGVIVLVMVLLVDVAALSRLSIVDPLVGALAFVAAAVLGRVSIVLATTASNTGARTNGFGALFHGVTSRNTALLWCGVGVALTALLGWVALAGAGSVSFGLASCTSLVAGWLWRRHLGRRLGGMTGDIFGSIIEVTQAVFLVSVALCVGLAGLI